MKAPINSWTPHPPRTHPLPKQSFPLAWTRVCLRPGARNFVRFPGSSWMPKFVNFPKWRSLKRSGRLGFLTSSRTGFDLFLGLRSACSLGFRTVFLFFPSTPSSTGSHPLPLSWRLSPNQRPPPPPQTEASQEESFPKRLKAAVALKPIG